MDLAHPAAGQLRGLLRLSALALTGMLCACGHFRELTALGDPLNSEEHLKLGASYEQQGLNDEAAIQYRAALRLDPSSAAAGLALGNRQFNAGDLAAAEKSYRRVLKSAPHHAGANNNLAMIYLTKNEKLAEAEALTREALRQESPLKPYILDTLANICIRQKRYAEAREALDEAERTPPAADSSFPERLRQTRRGMEEVLAEK